MNRIKFVFLHHGNFSNRGTGPGISNVIQWNGRSCEIQLLRDHHSTAIEGSSLTEPQANDLLEFGKTAKNKPFEDHQMEVDHYKALQFTVSEAETKKVLSVELIQRIASEVIKNTGGHVNTVIGTYDIAKGDFRLGTVRAGSVISMPWKLPEKKEISPRFILSCMDSMPNF